MVQVYLEICPSAIQSVFSVPRAESGEWVLYLASSRFPPRSIVELPEPEGGGEIAVSSDGVVGGGAYRSDWDGTIIPTKKRYKKLREQGMSEKWWSHTMQAFEDIGAGKVFTG